MQSTFPISIKGNTRSSTRSGEGATSLLNQNTFCPTHGGEGAAYSSLSTRGTVIPRTIRALKSRQNLSRSSTAKWLVAKIANRHKHGGLSTAQTQLKPKHASVAHGYSAGGKTVIGKTHDGNTGNLRLKRREQNRTQSFQTGQNRVWDPGQLSHLGLFCNGCRTGGPCLLAEPTSETGGFYPRVAPTSKNSDQIVRQLNGDKQSSTVVRSLDVSAQGNIAHPAMGQKDTGKRGGHLTAQKHIKKRRRKSIHLSCQTIKNFPGDRIHAATAHIRNRHILQQVCLQQGRKGHVKFTDGLGLKETNLGDDCRVCLVTSMRQAPTRRKGKLPRSQSVAGEAYVSYQSSDGVLHVHDLGGTHSIGFLTFRQRAICWTRFT